MASASDVVGADQDRIGNADAEGLRRLEVDHELELGGLLEREVGRLGSLEDLVDVIRGPPMQRRKVGAVEHESTRIDEEAIVVDRDHALIAGEPDQVRRKGIYERVALHEEALRAV